MDEIDEARGLLSAQKYVEAAGALDALLRTDPDSDTLWFLRGLVWLKTKNYDAAQECFERALFLGKKSKYYQVKGMAHFELFEVEDAIHAFESALAIEPDDATTNFFIAICYLFLDDPRGDGYMMRARELDKKKTSQLLLNFYTFFIKDDPRLNNSAKAKIEMGIRNLK